MGYLLHTAYQNQGTEPGVLMGLRTCADPIPAGERAFLLASTWIALEEGSTPVKVRNFVQPKGKGGAK